jgi:DNA processing protein
MIEGIGPIKVRALTDALGSPEAVFSAGRDDLLSAQGVGEQLADRILGQRERIEPEAEEAATRKLGARIITPLDEEYPGALKHIHDPPLALYIKGSLEKKDRHALAVVGSRRSTSYGNTVADRLSYQLAKVGFTVISGLARGIDTAAHRGALKGGGRTLAVLGSALDRIYPPESEELADAIAGQGAVISEFPLGREPDRTTFPYRNRIVSGMSLGVLVVEAGFKSGALHTADAALDQGKSVFAVPGRIDSGASKGTNRLIQAGAKLVADVDDILEEFETLFTAAPAAPDQPSARPALELSGEEQVLATVLLNGPVDIDTLARAADWDVSRVSSLLIGLEMKRVVRMLPGRRVELAVDLARDR